MEPESSIDNFISQYKIPLIMGLVGVVLLVGGIFSSGILTKTFEKQPQVQINKQATSAAIPPENTGQVAVDVSGEVINPGVYQLPAGSRVEDAIKAAGGVKTSADSVYVAKTLNLAQKVSDGMKIYLPQPQKSGQSASGTVAGASTQVTPININSASLAELDKLPGVGPVTAQKIIDGRPYSGSEELVTKKAVSKSVYEKIKAMVSVW